MKTKPNPFGLHSVTPYMVVKDVAGVIEFAKKVFDAHVRGEIHRDGNRIQHTEMVIGDSVIMMGEPRDPADSRPLTLYVYVDDCDKRYKMALNAGAVTIEEPNDRPHGDRLGGIKDPAGNSWWVVEHVGRK